MKEIMVVTRITIGGQQYTAEELGEEKVKEIVRQRMDAAVESMGYERTQKLRDQIKRRWRSARLVHGSTSAAWIRICGAAPP